MYSFGGRRSIVTPTVLHDTDAAPIRENGQLRMWFTSVDFSDGVHRLHDAVSSDGLEWSAPSESLLENAYAPSVIKDGPHLSHVVHRRGCCLVDHPSCLKS